MILRNMVTGSSWTDYYLFNLEPRSDPASTTKVRNANGIASRVYMEEMFVK